MRGMVMGVVAVVSASTARAADPVALAPGEVVIVRLAGPGQWTVAERTHPAALPVTGAEKAFAAQLHEGAPPPQVSTVLDNVASTPPPPNAIRFTLKTIVDQPGLILVVESGYPKRLSYSAMITTKGLPQPTSVCQVLSKVASLEYWPVTFTEIQLAGFALTDQPPSAPVACR